MQQTLISLTEQAILKLEQQGWRFRAGNKRLIVHKGETGNKTDRLLRQIKIGEACEYLTERAQSYIRQCREATNGKA